MRIWKQRPSLILLLVAALLVLLPLLAVLQYRWLGEVSAGERERMQANLKSGAERFCSDFDRELTNAYIQFQNTAQQSNESVERELAARYARWVAGAARPKLIRELYRTQLNDAGQLTLAHLNRASNTLKSVEWPEELKSLRERFETQRQSQQSAQMLLRSVLGQTQEHFQTRLARGFVLQISMGQLADDIPALVIPDAGGHFPSSPGELLPEKRACTIAVLDLDYIKNEMIPELAQRYFASEGTNDYNLAIVRRGEAKEVIYESDARLPVSAFEQSDVKTSLFKIRPEEVDRILIAGMPTPSSSPVPPSGRKIVAGTFQNQPGNVSYRVVQSDINIKKTAEGKPETVQIEGAMPRQLIKRSDDGNWQLLVKHRAGSLDAAVANVRRRNLAISFGILLLLGASMGFIVLSSRRSQHLATQQMEFVAGVSHELRTPLAVICSAAENLADGVPGLIDNRDQIKRYGSLIRDEGRRLTGMVEQVLEFAGAQSGRRTYELRPTEPHRVIEDAVAACHLQLVEGEFELEQAISANLPLIKADAAALSRAIQNLLSNAMKYSSDSHWIGLSADVVKTDRGNEIQIKVSDRGLGIATSELPHIFEPFYRGKEVVASQIHGNGLGLSLVKHIVDAHGGRVGVESNPGRGCAFTLSLPIISAEELSSESARESYEQTNFAR